MTSRFPLGACFIQTGMLFGVAVWASQWKLSAVPLEREAEYVVWGVGAGAVLVFLIDFVSWMQRTARLRQAIGLPAEFNRRLRVALQMIRFASWETVWLLAALGLLFVLGSRLQAADFYYNLVRGLGASLAGMIAAGSASLLWA